MDDLHWWERLIQIYGEKILKDAPLTCFSCDKSITEGSRFVCVNRLRRIKRDDSEDEILRGMASLQICELCANKARKKEIAIHRPPVPLLNIEKKGFYDFVKRSELTGQTKTPETKDKKCNFCGEPIQDGKHYFNIDVNIQEIKNKQIGVLPGTTVELATVCEKCAETYMLW
jgi:hypothetical protein